MELQARGRSRWLLFAVIGFCSCTSSLNEKVVFYDANSTNIYTQSGITYADATRISGVVFSLNEKSDTIFSITYRMGKENGYSRHYHSNGQLKSLRYNRNGWKEGEHKGWYENGQIQFVYHFKDDMFEGNQKEWLPDGTLYSDLNYKKGMESGSQRVWYPNGKIKTNYIIKNDRRYGLLGTKNCVNISDSVFVKP